MGEIYRGNAAISSIHRGNTAVSNVYRGNTEVWSAAAGIPVTTDGLIQYIDFNGGSYNGTSTLTDLSANGKNATMQGANLYGADNAGYGDWWDGNGASGNKLTYTEGSTPLWGAVTIQFWGAFTFISLSSFMRMFSITNQSRCDLAPSGGKWAFHSWGEGMGNWNTNLGNMPAINEVCMITYSQIRHPANTTDRAMYIYKNDGLVYERAATNTLDTRLDAYGYSLGNRYGSSNQSNTHRFGVYNFAFYKKMLTTVEIQANFNAQKATFGL
tara:strand:+ start:60 stop:869 length:810 start_codon:yes stop_codon:yes gene_type:complete